MSDIKKGENSFYIGDDSSQPKAEIHFLEDSNVITVDHTVVAEELSGQGIAGQLVEKVVEYAREQNKKIVPECSYARRKLETTEAYKDVRIMS